MIKFALTGDFMEKINEEEKQQDLKRIRERVYEIHQIIAEDIKKKDEFLKLHEERKAQLDNVVFELEKIYKKFEVL
jgi:uncharacterized protein (DUF3084 family)